MNNKGFSYEIREGDILQFREDINVIPAGVYRVDGVDEQMIYFMAGKSAVFGVERSCQGKMVKLPRESGKIKITALNSFLERYYRNLKARKGKAWSVTELASLPVTMCFIDPSVAALFEEELYKEEKEGQCEIMH